jgi:hypothetical protein
MRWIHYGFRLAKEITAFAVQHKKWWIIPLLLIFVLVAVLIIAGESSAPFIYTLF